MFDPSISLGGRACYFDLSMPHKPSPPRFRRPSLARPIWRARISNWARWWRGPIIALALILVWWFASPPNQAEQSWTTVHTRFALCGEGIREEGCVIDGDTVLVGSKAKSRRIRLTGYDAAELDGACEAERTLARTARSRLHQWLSQGPFEWDGGDNPPRDQYGRELRSARRTLDMV